jgi:hypothetical protein
MKNSILSNTLFILGGVFALFLSSLGAIERCPWLDRDFEVNLRPSFLYQYYRIIDASPHVLHPRANDKFYTLSASLAALGIEGEVETTLASTAYQRPALDNVCLAARYQFLTDVSGQDPVSLVCGALFIQAFRHSVRDPSSFHHGKCEGELFVSLGKEKSWYDFWTTRVWGMLSLGTADKGSSWMRGEIFAEKNCPEKSQMKVFLRSLCGFGRHAFSSIKPFEGYGPLRHRSVDIGASYSRDLDGYGQLDIAYSYRVYARNFPRNAQSLLLRWTYSLSIMDVVGIVKKLQPS